MINQPKLHLACGMNHLEGYVNIDKVAMHGVDKIIDLEIFPWPIEDDSAIEVRCDHYIEHIPHDTYAKKLLLIMQCAGSFEQMNELANKIDMDAPADGLILFMEELYRIMKVGGEAILVSPYHQSEIAWRDPTHQRAITEITYKYFNQEWLTISNLEHYGIKCNFNSEVIGYEYYQDVHYESKDEKLFATRCWHNVIKAMKVKLTKL